MADEPSVAGRFDLKFAKIYTGDATGAGVNLIAADPTKQIRVISLYLAVGAAISVRFRSATTDISGPTPLAANGGLSVPTDIGIFQTQRNEALNILASGIAQIGGAIAYILI